jgi:hypothetical protein
MAQILFFLPLLLLAVAVAVVIPLLEQSPQIVGVRAAAGQTHKLEL